MKPGVVKQRPYLEPVTCILPSREFAEGVAADPAGGGGVAGRKFLGEVEGGGEAGFAAAFADLMIETSVGVSTVRTVAIKRVDSDYLEEWRHSSAKCAEALVPDS